MQAEQVQASSELWSIVPKSHQQPEQTEIIRDKNPRTYLDNL